MLIGFWFLLPLPACATPYHLYRHALDKECLGGACHVWLCLASCVLSLATLNKNIKYICLFGLTHGCFLYTPRCCSFAWRPFLSLHTQSRVRICIITLIFQSAVGSLWMSKQGCGLVDLYAWLMWLHFCAILVASSWILTVFGPVPYCTRMSRGLTIQRQSTCCK